jgi:hypothetical protein
MAKPSGFSRQFGLRFDRGPYHYALTPWVWDANLFWRLPTPAVGGVDLRSFPAQSTAGGAPQGFAFTACLSSPGGTAIATVPHMSEAVTTTAMRDAWENATGYRPDGAMLVDLLFDQLTTGSDPSGQSGPKPLVPTTSNELILRVGGHSVVKREQFRWGHHPHTNRLRDLLRLDFEREWERTNGSDHCRRCLDFTCKKYGVNEWHEFVPARLHAHVPGRLPHATTITESFPNDTADLDTATEDLDWTETNGTWDVTGGQCRNNSGSGVVADARAESDLSSDDHYAQVIISQSPSGASRGCGPATRFAAAARTYYFILMEAEATDTIEIWKSAAAVLTSLAGPTGFTESLPDTFRLEVDGSDLDALANGASIVTVTDTAITGNTRTGLHGQSGGATKCLYDTFEAADLAAAFDAATFQHPQASIPCIPKIKVVSY